MNLIVAVDSNWAIGYNNSLLVKIPNDMKFFRNQTTGKVIVMGRKTFESFPQKQPLGNRTNIILSSNKNYSVKGAIVVHSIPELKKELEKYPVEDIYVIGGDSVYKALIDYCSVAYVTKILHEYQADTYFPNLDNMKEWVMREESEEQTYFNLEYTFTKYEKVKPD